MNGDLSQNDQEFVAEAKQILDRTAEEIDPATELRLQRARLFALDGHSKRTRWLLWVSAAGIASVAALALTLWMNQPVPEHHAAVALEDIELVTSVENVELAEDLDFYHWLANDDATG